MQTKVIGGGTVVPGVELGVDPTFQAARVSIRPYDYQLQGQLLGHYRLAVATSAIAPAGGSVLFSLRWADASRFLVLQRFSASVTVVTAVTAQRTDPLALFMARGYTASETTNITAVNFAGNNQKARSSMGSSLVTQAAVSSAAAGISGGTKALDTQAISTLALAGLGAIGTGFLTDDLVRYDQFGMHPEMLATNEGLVLQWGATTLATGTVAVNVVMAWAEVVTI